MMNEKKILSLIEKGEGLSIEFKQRFSSHEKIAKEIIAFANTRGGTLIFGVDDNGSIYGVESEKETAELFRESALNYCEPPIEYSISFLELQNKEIVVVNIPESLQKPHRIQDFKTELDLNNAQVYVRVNDKSVGAAKEMIKLMQTGTTKAGLTNYKIGKIEKTVFDYLDNHEQISVKELSAAANISNRRASRTLINLVRAGTLLIHTKENGEEFFTQI